MANNPFVYAESVSYTKKNLMRGTANDELAEKLYKDRKSTRLNSSH